MSTVPVRLWPTPDPNHKSPPLPGYCRKHLDSPHNLVQTPRKRCTAAVGGKTSCTVPTCKQKNKLKSADECTNPNKEATAAEIHKTNQIRLKPSSHQPIRGNNSKGVLRLANQQAGLPLETVAVISPHHCRIDVGRRLVVGVRKHRDHANDDSFHPKNGTPALLCRFLWKGTLREQGT